MMYEVRYLYYRSRACIAKLDPELSVPKCEISDDKANAYMALLTDMGYKRHETATQIFFDHTIDCNHSEEYIFYK